MYILPIYIFKISCYKRLSSQEKKIYINMSGVMNGILSNKNVNWQHHEATSQEYYRESISCCVAFTKYTSLLKFGMPFLEFHLFIHFYL